MASNLLTTLRNLETARKKSINNARTANLPADDNMNFDNISELFLLQNNEQMLPGEHWVRPADWPDTETILNNAENKTVDGVTYYPFCILLLQDIIDEVIFQYARDNSLATNPPYKDWNTSADAYIFSDSPETLVVGDTTHTFDTTKDIPCSLGYKTRWVLCYTKAANRCRNTARFGRGFPILEYFANKTTYTVVPSFWGIKSSNSANDKRAGANQYIIRVAIKNKALYSQEYGNIYTNPNLQCLELSSNNILSVSEYPWIHGCPLKKLTLDFPAATISSNGSGRSLVANVNSISEFYCTATNIAGILFEDCDLSYLHHLDDTNLPNLKYIGANNQSLSDINTYYADSHFTLKSTGLMYIHLTNLEYCYMQLLGNGIQYLQLPKLKRMNVQGAGTLYTQASNNMDMYGTKTTTQLMAPNLQLVITDSRSCDCLNALVKYPTQQIYFRYNWYLNCNNSESLDLSDNRISVIINSSYSSYIVGNYLKTINWTNLDGAINSGSSSNFTFWLNNAPLLNRQTIVDLLNKIGVQTHTYTLYISPYTNAQLTQEDLDLAATNGVTIQVA